jgi:hypothetical protein
VVESGRNALSLVASMVSDVIVLDLHLQMAETIQGETDLVLIKPVKYKVLQDRAVELARV